MSFRTPMERRRLILQMIADYVEKHGWAPTIREIQEAVGLASTASVHYHLHKLELEGKLVLGGGTRMIRLSESDELHERYPT